MPKQDNDNNTLAHTKWNCKYHTILLSDLLVVTAPFNRKESIYLRHGLTEEKRSFIMWLDIANHRTVQHKLKVQNEYRIEP